MIRNGRCGCEPTIGSGGRHLTEAIEDLEGSSEGCEGTGIRGLSEKAYGSITGNPMLITEP